MISKIDLRDFFEINQGLYDESAPSRQFALLQALTQTLEPFDDKIAGRGPGGGHEHENTR